MENGSRLQRTTERINKNNLENFIATYKVASGISNKDLARLLISIAHGLTDTIDTKPESIEWDILYKEKTEAFKEKCKPTFDNLIDLYKELEQHLVDWLIEHPEILKNIKDIRDEEALNTDKRLKGKELDVGFTFGFDDLFGRLKNGFPGSQDIYCGFNVGRKNICIQ